MSDASLPTLPVAADQFLLRSGISFLNHGSFGACPKPVLETFQNWQRDLEAQPVEFLGRRISELLAQARAGLATYLNTAANNVVYVPNATYGVNIVAHSLDLKPGDEVLGTNHEYGACERAWIFNGRRTGARYVTQPITLPITNADDVVDQLWEGVNERTKVIFVSHITSPTALILPIAKICQRARKQGIVTVIDGAHAPGQIDVDLSAIDADFYTGNCHKWLCAPKSAGFLYARPELQSSLQPLVVSWGWESNSPGISTFLDYFEWRGTHDPAAYLSVPAAINFQAEHNWSAVRAACHELLLQASHRIAELSGKPQNSPDTAEWWSQMRTIPLPKCDLSVLKDRLWDDYQIEVPMVGWNNGHYIRVSIQAYNSQDDVDRLVEALKKLVP